MAGGQTGRVGATARSLVATALFAVIVGCSALASGTDSVQLTIHFAGDRNQFSQGEVIELELVFSSPEPETYTVSTRSYDRSGRLDIDKIRITPDTRDPLRDYYTGLLGGFLGGGLSGSKNLGEEPYVYRMEINEWAAFDRPGRYTVEISSSRVTRRDSPAGKRVPLELRSNRLEFEIVEADVAWQVRSLAEAVATLDSATSDDAQRRHARRVIRFLDSPPAVAELVRRLGSPEETDRWEWKAGLLGSRHRSAAIEELERGLSAPDIALTYDYAFVLAALRFLLEHTEPMPPYPADNAAQQEAWRALSEERSRGLQGLIHSAGEQAMRTISLKQGRAKAATLHSLITWPNYSGPRVRAQLGQMAAELAPMFAVLSLRQQEEMLQYRWRRIRSPAMVPALHRILDQPRLDSHSLRGTALRRLMQLDPSGGAVRILKEIRRPHQDSNGAFVSPEILGLLPETMRPDLDELLVTRLESPSETMERDAQLIARYASRGVAARVKAVYQKHRQMRSCLLEDGLLSYFVRVDLPFALREIRNYQGVCTLDAALREFKKRGQWSAVEPVIVALLQSDQIDLVRRAAGSLQRYGSEQSGDALWRRLERFHEQWARREDELYYGTKVSDEVRAALEIQLVLISTLSAGQGWLLTAEGSARMSALALGDGRQQLATGRRSDPMNLTISLNDGRLTGTLDQYSMYDLEDVRAKLAQLPLGSRLGIYVWGEEDDAQTILQDLKTFAVAQGLEVVNMVKPADE